MELLQDLENKLPYVLLGLLAGQCYQHGDRFIN